MGDFKLSVVVTNLPVKTTTLAFTTASNSFELAIVPLPFLVSIEAQRLLQSLGHS
jgi:ACR3 family arsenite efflux pump ArsB